MRLGKRALTVLMVLGTALPAGAATAMSVVARPAPKPEVTQNVHYAPPVIHASVDAGVENVTPHRAGVAADVSFNREGNLHDPELWVLVGRSGHPDDTGFSLRSEGCEDCPSSFPVTHGRVTNLALGTVDKVCETTGIC